MPVLLAVLAAIIVIVLYLWLCILAVQYLVVAFAGWIVVIGATAGAAAALSLAGHAVASGSARLLGPDQVNDETYFRKHPSAYRRDPAWPHYLARQGRDDLAAAGNAVLHAIERVWAGAGVPLQGRARHPALLATPARRPDLPPRRDGRGARCPRGLPGGHGASPSGSPS